MRRSVYAGFGVAFVGLVVAAFMATQTKAQTVCPVSAKPVDGRFYVDYQGQRIYFCCGTCPAEFRADPEKFLARAAGPSASFENIQTTCPVSGERLPPRGGGDAIEVSYRGRTVRLCCPQCKPKFEADPARFLAQLPGERGLGGGLPN